MSAETAVQGALYSALSALGLRVVDAGQQAADGGLSTAFPFVEIGMVVMSPFDTARETGHAFVARIHTRSASASMAETKGIQGQIYDRLHRGNLTVTGHHFILLQRDRSEVLRAPSGAFHGVCEYRGLIEKT
jgi:hypothetical protein